YRNIGRADDETGLSGVEERAVAVAAAKPHMGPRVLGGRVGVVHAAVQLTRDSVFPCDPLHHAVGCARGIDHVAGPSREVAAADDVAAVAGAGLIEPQAPPLPRLAQVNVEAWSGLAVVFARLGIET